VAAERVGAPSVGPAASTSPRAVWRGNDDANANEETVGKVTWRVEPANAVGAQIEGVRADVEIPDRKLRMTMVFRRNADVTQPAAKLIIEMRFQVAPDSGELVANVPGVFLKSDERGRPSPLSGLATKGDDGSFLFMVADMAFHNDPSRNRLLLRDRPWFDVPLNYADKHRAIIAIEKGAPGERAFNEAFAAWG
jgi:hypothetical protein